MSLRKVLDPRVPTPSANISSLNNIPFFFSSKYLICLPLSTLLLRASIPLTLKGAPPKYVLQPTHDPDVWGWYRDPGKDGKMMLHLSLSHSVWDTVGQTQLVMSCLPRLYSGCFKGMCHVVFNQVGPDTLALCLIWASPPIL